MKISPLVNYRVWGTGTNTEQDDPKQRFFIQ